MDVLVRSPRLLINIVFDPWALEPANDMLRHIIRRGPESRCIWSGSLPAVHQASQTSASSGFRMLLFQCPHEVLR